MPNRIKADSASGLQLISDSSDEIQIQSGTDTVATINSSGLSSPGHVIQVVQDRHSSQVLTSSSTYQDTGLTATITPSSTSSKILIIVDHNGTYANGAGNIQFDSKLFRDATELSRSTSGLGTSQTLIFGTVAHNYLDSPATTSAITYKTQFRNSQGTGDIGFNTYANSSGITLMEIAG